jgi:hypothetical protein
VADSVGLIEHSVMMSGHFWLLCLGHLMPAAKGIDGAAVLKVLTPQSVIRPFAKGFMPIVHSSRVYDVTF